MRNLTAIIVISASTMVLALGVAAAATPAAKPAAAAPAAAAVTIKDPTGATFTGDATAGERTFHQCMTCHKIEAGKNGIGPSLHGIVGRKAGSLPDYTYTGAMKNSGLTWTEQTLADYLVNPRKLVPGTKMTFAGLAKAQDRANVIAYLKTAAK